MINILKEVARGKRGAKDLSYGKPNMRRKPYSPRLLRRCRSARS